MFVKPVIRPPDQPVGHKPAFIASNQQDGATYGIKGKRHPPDAAISGKAQFLHVGVARSDQRINLRTPKQRPELTQQFCCGEQFILNRLAQPIELRLEGRMQNDRPFRPIYIT